MFPAQSYCEFPDPHSTVAPLITDRFRSGYRPLIAAADPSATCGVTFVTGAVLVVEFTARLPHRS
jgi:hypothetical protein